MKGSLGGWLSGEHLPLAQDGIPGSGIESYREWNSPSTCVSASLCVSHEKVNKIFKKETWCEDCLQAALPLVLSLETIFKQKK